MQEYTVKQVSEMLNTNPETVRRWIRSGKLKAVQDSKKSGNIISSDALQSFLRSRPKYAGTAAKAVTATTATAVVGAAAPMASLAMGIGFMTASLIRVFSNQSKPLTSSDVKTYLEKDIRKSEDTVKRKSELIAQLQKELADEQARLEGLKYVLDHEDLEKMADDINSHSKKH